VRAIPRRVFVPGVLIPSDQGELAKAAASGYSRRRYSNVFSRTLRKITGGDGDACHVAKRERTARLPQGKLSFYEEFPEDAADVIR